ncbi:MULTISPECIES: cytochrome c biogenesis protein CcdA [unclassified Dehalobacter]|jgi:Thiol:disulfide interchange protein|uniref:cytochrome c biogenesis protein CcdA n=1 Tax=unclassified Dehalobacter TaxID=2635733 RepID=UPI00028B3238|nr:MULTISPECIES: cytochrome c biogenesis protein CcdA [unclassified Dehalobacter]AFV01189.1 putative cytochrome c biogenesis protein [Dehalobacter sp. DCA]AFV04231.1 putative c-type cytochrome biogenesis protein [Dehalobacter sp. CF]
MINLWLETLSTLISESFWLAPILALLAGVLTSITPCALTSVPLVIGYVGGTGNNDPKKAFRLSLAFALGMAVTFTTLGTAASLLGKLIGTSSPWWYIALGVLMVLMALQTWEVYNFIPSTFLTSKTTKKGYIGAFVTGILGGVFSSPCATPVLVVLLGIVARSGNVAWGVLLLLLYSVGHSVLVLAAGTSVGLVKKVTSSGRYGIFSKVLKYFMGGVILLIAFYMFYLAF